MPSLAEWIGLVTATGVGAMGKSSLDAALGRKKNRADAQKAGSEGEKAEAEAAEKLTQIALSLVEPVSKKLAEVSKDFEDHKARVRDHMEWDRTAAEQIRALGGDIDDPPPLYKGGH